MAAASRHVPALALLVAACQQGSVFAAVSTGAADRGAGSVPQGITDAVGLGGGASVDMLAPEASGEAPEFSSAMYAEFISIALLWVVAITYGVWQAKLGLSVVVDQPARGATNGSRSQAGEQELAQRSTERANGNGSAADAARTAEAKAAADAVLAQPPTGTLSDEEQQRRHSSQQTQQTKGSRRGGAAGGTRSSNASFTNSSFLSQASKAQSSKSNFAAEMHLTNQDGTNTFVGTIVNIITGGLGAGILCLPWAAAGASLSTALVIIFLVLVVNAYTIDILIQAGQEREVYDIAALLGELPGSVAGMLQTLCNVVVWGTLLLCLVSYYIVIADCTLKALESIPAFAETVIGSHDLCRSIVLVVAAALLVPMCFLDQDMLAYTSTITVAVNVFVFFVIGWDTASQFSLGPGVGAWAGRPVCVFGLGLGSIAFFATLMQCVVLQMCVLPMYVEMKDRSPRKFKHVVRSSFAGLYLLFSGFAFAGVMAYGETKVSDNVLNNLPSNLAGFFSQAGMVFCIMSVYPIMFMPMVAPLKQGAYKNLTIPVSLGVIAFTCLAAFPLRNLGEISIICGSLSVGIFVGIIPALIGYYLLGKGIVSMSLLAASMSVMAVLGLIYRENIYEGDVCIAEAW